MIAMLGRDDAHANSAVSMYMVLLDIQLAAGEGGGAEQDAVKDDGGGMIVGGGEDRGKDCGNADGNGHGRSYGHGQCQCSDATSTR
jgi:hypothetical protein